MMKVIIDKVDSGVQVIMHRHICVIQCMFTFYVSRSSKSIPLELLMSINNQPGETYYP